MSNFILQSTDYFTSDTKEYQNKCKTKQVRAFQILAGGEKANAMEFIEKDGADGFSTFMAYYILSADAIAGGSAMPKLIKEYFGGMLERGATTFWEDFDLKWLIGSGRIDCLPQEQEKDIHGDFGRYCYKGFRHSLCHGWSSGVLSFIIEYMMGIHIADGGECIIVDPHPFDVDEMFAEIPVKNGILSVSIQHGKANYIIKSLPSVL